MKKKINILFIIDFFYGSTGGGTETHLSYLARKLNKERFNCLIVAFDSGDTQFIEAIRNDGIPIVHIPVGRYYTLNALKRAIELTRLIKKHHTDIVQTFHIKSDTYGALIAKNAGVKRIVSSKRDTGDNKNRWHFFMNRRLNHIFSGFIVVADKVGEIVSSSENIPRERMTTLYNGVDTKRFSPPDDKEKIEAKDAIGLKKDDFVIGMVAVFRPEKNHDIFFSAMQMLLSKIPNLKVVTVGEGPTREFCMDFCKTNNFDDKVLFPGATREVEKYIKAFDVACLVPGSNEGFSNAIIENMAMGLPMVVSDVGGNAEAVMHEFNGFVVKPFDTNAIAEAVFRLFADETMRNEMGKNSRERVEQKFTLEKMIHDHEDFYESLMIK